MTDPIIEPHYTPVPLSLYSENERQQRRLASAALERLDSEPRSRQVDAVLEALDIQTRRRRRRGASKHRASELGPRRVVRHSGYVRRVY